MTRPRADVAGLLEALAGVIGSPDLPSALELIERVLAEALGARRVEIRLEPVAGPGAKLAAADSGERDEEGRAPSFERPLLAPDGRELGRVIVTPAADAPLGDEDERLLSALLAAAGAALDRHQLIAALEDGQRQRQAFFGVVSHELRTPITTIYGGTRVLRQSGARLSHDARQQLLDDIGQEAERLYRLVEDLLVLSRAEREALIVTSEPILVQHLVARVVASEQQRWPRATLRADTQRGLPPVLGDSTLVEQVLRNLISNAAKYAGESGPIDITATDAGGWVEVRVLDAGPGLAAQEATQVFDLFYRAADAASRAQGAGIGLYACRQLILAMGGDIWVTSRPTGGAEFGFRLAAQGVDEDATRTEARE